MKVAEYIENNMEVFKAFVKIGAVPSCYIGYFSVYQVFRSTKHLKSKMERYNLTADLTKNNLNTVRNAVKCMESIVKK